MKTIKKHTVKQMYICPEIFFVKLDNEISLALESTPPSGPDESNLTPEYKRAVPFMDDIA